MTRTAVGKRQHVHFYLDENVFEAARKIAAQRNTTYSEIIRIACREYVVREAAKAATESKTIQERYS